MGDKKFHIPYTALACFVCFIANVYAYLPGFLSPDSIDQYGQSLTGQYNDWHPIAMAVFWSLLNKFFVGPQVMLVYQVGCLWLSIYLLLLSTKKAGWRIAIWIFAFAPFVQNFAGYIIKDSQMALSWLLSCSILFFFYQRNKAVPVYAAIISGLLLVYGCLVRPNAIPGAIPLYLFWAWMLVYNNRKLMIAAYSLLLILITIVSNYFLSYRFFDVTRSYPQNKLYLHDMAAVFVQTGEPVYPPQLFENNTFDTTAIKEKYHPATYDMLWWNQHGQPIHEDLNNEEKTYLLQNAWINTITAHPFLYLSNRWESFLYFLRLKKRSDDFTYYISWISDNKFGLQVKGGRVHDTFIRSVTIHKQMPYMRPWFWFFLNIILLAFIQFAGKNRAFYIAILLSSLMYVLPQFFISQTDTDFRYMYWNCIACSLALIILISDARKKADTKLS